MVHVFTYQLAIFFTNTITRPDQFLSKLNESSGNIFDSMPQIIPLPPEIPPEIPRVSSTSASGIYSINISLSRMDITMNMVDSPLKEGDAISDFILKAKLIIKNIPSDVQLNRIGIIGSYFELDKNPAITLSRKLAKKDLGNVSEFNLRYNKPSSDFGYTFNNIYSINNAQIDTRSISSNGVFIQKDINNMPSETPMSKDLLIEILTKKIKELATSSIEGIL
ncbi:Uncharacterised protein [Klebsiella pneumoniae]|nr:Uncharacterised protein [Klebsiella pneumoniae]SBL72813.1 Uncharacterised protein [Klebsiella grimontii]SXD89203.1 Uncharacterised protein [Klebsiella variicola]SBZ30693.1 Uncharacterised protein [Klebsiella pneumoniae]SSH09974.1 Uncharacterised protein [Klebsiella pneumoniae]